MTNLESTLSLHSDGAPWQNFLNAMLTFKHSRVKNEPISELYKSGLEVYLHFPLSKCVSLFLLDTDGYLFHHSQSLPSEYSESRAEKFNSLLNAGAIASSLQSGKIVAWELSAGDNKQGYFLINPLIDHNGVSGLVIIEFESRDTDIEQLLLGLCDLHSSQFTSLINNAKLLKNLNNTQSILEQKISLKTEELKRSKRELQLVLDSIHTGVFIIDPKTNKIIDTNIAALDILKMPREWIINTERSDFTFYETGKTENHKEVIRPEMDVESSLRNKEGREVPIIRTITNINFGENIYFLESFIDISERKSTFRALLESESRFRTIFEKSGIGMVITDLEGKVLDSNEAFNSMVGYEPGEILRSNFRDFLFHREAENNKYSYEKGSRREEKVLKKDGSLVWCKITSSFMRDSSEKPLFGIEMIEDISESKKHEEVLELQTNLLNGVADATTELLAELDFEKSIINALRLIGKATGADRVFIYNFKNLRKEILLERKYGWVKNDNDDKYSAAENYKFRLSKKTSSWYKSFKQGITICGLTNNVSGEEKEVLEYFGVHSFLAIPIYIEDAIWGFIGLDDCLKERVWTENEESMLKAIAVAVGGAIQRNRVQDELMASKEKAEKAVKLKTEFLAQMSHEIRTPINSILNFSGIIKEELSNKIDDDLKTGLKIIDKAGKRIIRTVDLILNMSDIQTGHYEVHATRVNLYSDILQKQYLDFVQHARDKNLDFKLHKPVGDTDIVCDEYTVNQIINNIIDNALKYTMKGCVEIFVHNDGNNYVSVSVNDTGIGISEEYMSRIFDPFTQEEQGYSRKFEGNGLGMALVKKYCELNRAKISLRSKKGIGTELKVSFPRVL